MGCCSISQSNMQEQQMTKRSKSCNSVFNHHQDYHFQSYRTSHRTTNANATPDLSPTSIQHVYPQSKNITEATSIGNQQIVRANKLTLSRMANLGKSVNITIDQSEDRYQQSGIQSENEALSISLNYPASSIVLTPQHQFINPQTQTYQQVLQPVMLVKQRSQTPTPQPSHKLLNYHNRQNLVPSYQRSVVKTAYPDNNVINNNNSSLNLENTTSTSTIIGVGRSIWSPVQVFHSSSVNNDSMENNMLNETKYIASTNMIGNAITHNKTPPKALVGLGPSTPTGYGIAMPVNKNSKMNVTNNSLNTLGMPHVQIDQRNRVSNNFKQQNFPLKGQPQQNNINQETVGFAKHPLNNFNGEQAQNILQNICNQVGNFLDQNKNISESRNKFQGNENQKFKIGANANYHDNGDLIKNSQDLEVKIRIEGIEKLEIQHIEKLNKMIQTQIKAKVPNLISLSCQNLSLNSNDADSALQEIYLLIDYHIEYLVKKKINDDQPLSYRSHFQQSQVQEIDMNNFEKFIDQIYLEEYKSIQVPEQKDPPAIIIQQEQVFRSQKKQENEFFINKIFFFFTFTKFQGEEFQKSIFPISVVQDEKEILPDFNRLLEGAKISSRFDQQITIMKENFYIQNEGFQKIPKKKLSEKQFEKVIPKESLTSQTTNSSSLSCQEEDSAVLIERIQNQRATEKPVDFQGLLGISTEIDKIKKKYNFQKKSENQSKNDTMKDIQTQFESIPITKKDQFDRIYSLINKNQTPVNNELGQRIQICQNQNDKGHGMKSEQKNQLENQNKQTDDEQTLNFISVNQQMMDSMLIKTDQAGNSKNNLILNFFTCDEYNNENSISPTISDRSIAQMPKSLLRDASDDSLFNKTKLIQLNFKYEGFEGDFSSQRCPQNEDYLDLIQQQTVDGSKRQQQFQKNAQKMNRINLKNQRVSQISVNNHQKSENNEQSQQDVNYFFEEQKGQITFRETENIPNTLETMRQDTVCNEIGNTVQNRSSYSMISNSGEKNQYNDQFKETLKKFDKIQDILEELKQHNESKTSEDCESNTVKSTKSQTINRDSFTQNQEIRDCQIGRSGEKSIQYQGDAFCEMDEKQNRTDEDETNSQSPTKSQKQRIQRNLNLDALSSNYESFESNSRQTNQSSQGQMKQNLILQKSENQIINLLSQLDTLNDSYKKMSSEIEHNISKSGNTSLYSSMQSYLDNKLDFQMKDQCKKNTFEQN